MSIVCDHGRILLDGGSECEKCAAEANGFCTCELPTCDNQAPTGPRTYEQALDLVLAEMRTIMLDRQRKYGPNNILRGGVHGLITRIGDKLARIEQDHDQCLFQKCDGRIELPDEQEADAWLDLANYAGPIALMLQRGWWELPLEEA